MQQNKAESKIHISEVFIFPQILESDLCILLKVMPREADFLDHTYNFLTKIK